MKAKTVIQGALAIGFAVLGSCSSSSSTPTPDAGQSGFTPPADPGPGGILFAVSGEVLALTGYAFPPVNDGDPAFVDGWQVSFTRLLTTVDKITLSSNPDVSPGNQALTGPAPGSVGGGLVAEVDGPWAVEFAWCMLAHHVLRGVDRSVS